MEVQILRSYDVCRLRSNATTDWNLSHTRLQQPRESNERHPRNCEVRGHRVVMGDKVRNIIVEHTMAKSPPCVLAFLATALHLIDILTVKIETKLIQTATMLVYSFFSVFFSGGASSMTIRVKVYQQISKNGMNIGRKDIAIGVQMYHGTHLKGRN